MIHDDPGPDTHYVYRCYDAEGTLLYIGCTRDIGSRMGVHFVDWRSPVSRYLKARMARHEVVEYPDRAWARKAEREAIAAEAPLLNTLHNKGRGRIPPLEVPAVDPERLARVLAGFGHPPDG